MRGWQSLLWSEQQKQEICEQISTLDLVRVTTKLLVKVDQHFQKNYEYMKIIYVNRGL